MLRVANRVAGRSIVFFCLLLCAAPASAGEREWKAARKAYDQAREAVEADRGKDPDKTEKALGALSTKTTELLKANQVKGTEHLLKDALVSDAAPVVRMAVEALSRVKDKRAAKALAKEMAKAKGDQKVLLIRILTEVHDPSVVAALLKLLKDRDAETRAAACKALAVHGEKAKDSAKGPLKRLLKDSSLRVRVRAADALQAMTGERPKGFPSAVRDPETGLPSRFNVDRIAFLIDATSAMSEVAFSDPFAPPPPEAGDKDGDAKDGDAKDGDAKDGDKEKKRKPRKKRGEKEAKPEPPKPFSPFQIAGGMVHTALERMNTDNRIHLARFGRSSRVYSAGFGPAPAKKKLGEIDDWLDASLSREVNRDLLSAVKQLVEAKTAPQQIYIFLGGSPTNRGRSNEEETLEAVRELLWVRDIELHVVGFVLEHASPAKTKAEQADRDERESKFLKFISDVTQLSGGLSTRIDVFRLREPEPVDDKPKKDEPEFAKGVDLTKPIASGDVSTVKKALKAAFEKPTDKAVEFVENVAANPDPRKVALQLLGGLRGDDPAMSGAVARGIARNTNAQVHDFVFKALDKERDPARQMLLLSASGTAKGPKVSEGLINALKDLKSDPLRMAWYYVSDRPTKDLVAFKGKVARYAKDLTGLTGFYASKALAKSNGKPAPVESGLVTAAKRFLPDRYVGLGTAFIIDTHRDMDQILWAPPEPKEDKKKADPDGEKDKKKKKKKKRGKKEEAKKPEKAPDPVSCLQGARLEVERALKAIAKSEGRANVLTSSGDRWHATCATLDEAAVKKGSGYLAKARTSSKRDVWAPLRMALNDSSVEEIHLIVSGPPLRSPGAREVSELLDKVREVNRAREVAIQVVYVLPPADGSTRGAARRSDLLDAMNAVYEPLASENGGRVVIRSSLDGLAVKKAKK